MERFSAESNEKPKVCTVRANTSIGTIDVQVIIKNGEYQVGSFTFVGSPSQEHLSSQDKRDIIAKARQQETGTVEKVDPPFSTPEREAEARIMAQQRGGDYDHDDELVE